MTTATPEELIAGYNAHLDKISNRHPGKSTYLRCEVCGYLDWLSSQTNEPKSVVIQARAPSYGTDACPRCFAVMQRAPEIFEWVIGVLHHRELRAAEATMEKTHG